MYIDSVVIIESERVDKLYPFSILHSAWELRCGTFMLFEKIQKAFPESRLIFRGRSLHLASFLARSEHDEQSIRPENLLLINSTLLPDSEFINGLNKTLDTLSKENKNDETISFMINNIPVSAFIPEKEITKIHDKDNYISTFFLEKFKSSRQIEIQNVKLIEYLWDTIEYNGKSIIDDSIHFQNTSDFEELISTGIFLINKDKIIIDKSAEIAPTVVLDASNGNIIIDKNVKIYPHSSIYGPCYIGENTIIKSGTKIYENTAIGNTCKVAGEIENSILQSFSNKQHDGYLGHSYLCEWVNIGAGTNTSDLKNTYSPISVQLEKIEIDTGRTFLGLLCGDHTKTAINTVFTTGTIAGIFGIIVADGFLPRYIPSFAWRGTKGSTYYKIDKAIETANIAMGRRNCHLLNEELTLIEKEYKKISG